MQVELFKTSPTKRLCNLPIVTHVLAVPATNADYPPEGLIAQLVKAYG